MYWISTIWVFGGTVAETAVVPSRHVGLQRLGNERCHVRRIDQTGFGLHGDVTCWPFFDESKDGRLPGMGRISALALAVYEGSSRVASVAGGRTGDDDHQSEDGEESSFESVGHYVRVDIVCWKGFHQATFRAHAMLRSQGNGPAAGLPVDRLTAAGLTALSVHQDQPHNLATGGFHAPTHVGNSPDPGPAPRQREQPAWPLRGAPRSAPHPALRESRG